MDAFLNCSLAYFLRKGLSRGLELTDLPVLSGPASLGDPLVSTSPVLGLQMCAGVPGFLCGFLGCIPMLSISKAFHLLLYILHGNIRVFFKL